MTFSEEARPKLAVFDIDGTLAGPDFALTDSACEALKRLGAQGVPIAIATGRSRPELPRALQEMAVIGYLIATNGTVVQERATGRALADHRIPREKSLALLRLFRAYRAGYFLYDGELDFSDLQGERNGDAWQAASGIARWHPMTVLPDAEAHIAAQTAGMTKFAGYIPDGGFEALRDEALALGALGATSALPDELEIVPEGIDKGSALADLCGALRIDLAEVFAVGDGDNDAEMLRLAGFSVAMGNASSAAKAAARYETSGVLEDGVLRAVERFFG